MDQICSIIKLILKVSIILLLTVNIFAHSIQLYGFLMSEDFHSQVDQYYRPVTIIYYVIYIISLFVLIIVVCFDNFILVFMFMLISVFIYYKNLNTKKTFVKDIYCKIELFTLAALFAYTCFLGVFLFCKKSNNHESSTYSV